MKLKPFIESILRPFPRLFSLASKVYHGTNRSFKTLSPGTPEAIEKSFKKYIDEYHPTNTVGYYEFGLFRGFTFYKAYEAAKQYDLATEFYGFDSFMGLPEVDGVDKVDNRFFKGQYACTKEKVVANLKNYGVDTSKINLFEGFYEQSLTKELHQQVSFKPASIVLFDCDLYSSTKLALDWVTPYLHTGSILLFDDWFSFENTSNLKDTENRNTDESKLGQPKAYEEFLNKNPQFVSTELWDFKNHGRAFQLT